MKRLYFSILLLSLTTAIPLTAQWGEEMALKLAELPLNSIHQEFPNKTGHTYSSMDDVKLSPRDLHPAFYGSFDWHSSVHGHWMLIRVLKLFPENKKYEEIVRALDESFRPENLQAEADYFTIFENGKIFERTYGWAWLLKLDNELMLSDHPKMKQWHADLQPLTEIIVSLWKDYLPKQNYPDRTGVHPNSAFALNFALDWARVKGDKEFEQALIEKAISFYADEKNTPAWLEPNGSDFFSPSLQIASLMGKIYQPKEFQKWYSKFMSKRSFVNVCKVPVVSDVNDYYMVHLVGLSFSKAWCMKDIAYHLPEKSSKRKVLNNTANELIEKALPLLFAGNYGGDHWLASFALLAMDDKIE